MSIDAAIFAVADFLQPLIPSAAIVRGQTNDVPPPLPPSLVITEVGKPQYTTTRNILDPLAGMTTFIQPTQLRLQMDFYGNTAGEMSGIATTMLRSLYATENFPDGVEPLYCSDPIQSPLTTGEKQFQARWTSELFVQYNAPITVNQESFNVVGEVSVDPANVTIPLE